MTDAAVPPAVAAPIDYTVALRGFTAFERAALASVFRLAAQRAPRYLQVDSLTRADFVLADADHGATLAAVQAAGRASDTVFIGAAAPEAAMARLARPIDPLGILRELDALANRRGAQPDIAEPVAAESALPASFDSGEPPPGRQTARPPLNSGLMDLGAETAAPARPERRRRLRSRTRPSDVRRVEMLVVENSRIAARFLQSRLQAMGHRVTLAAGGRQALDLLARKRFDAVFLDLQLGSAGSIDGIELCRHIKHGDDDQPRPDAAVVIVVSGTASAADRVRCSLAGCDAFLAKPLQEAQLLEALAPFVPIVGVAPSPSGRARG